MFKVFQKHPDVKIVNKAQNIDNWEPNYWYWAVRAIAGDKRHFVRKLGESVPNIRVPSIVTKTVVFDIWDQILNMFGPVVFDKSPIYLEDPAATDIMLRYMSGRKRKFIFFAFIRDPRDSIVSQHRKWPGESLKQRERAWLRKYNLESLAAKLKFPIYRYEDVASNPKIFIPKIFRLCELKDIESAYRHIRPVHVGRYKEDEGHDVAGWKFDAAFTVHLKKYGYG
jgi:hypothetical protein